MLSTDLHVIISKYSQYLFQCCSYHIIFLEVPCEYPAIQLSLCSKELSKKIKFLHRPRLQTSLVLQGKTVEIRRNRNFGWSTRREPKPQWQEDICFFT
jgi:hypothetical protein